LATFVHLAPEKRVARIRRHGIASRSRLGLARGVLAMPVVRSYYVSHQWLRELRRCGDRAFAGVYFRVADDRPVLVGHYGSGHRRATAAEAVAIVAAEPSAEGYEVFIPGRVEPEAIRRVRRLRRVLGWRYFPGAHGRPPCACPVCLPRGAPWSRRIRERRADG